MKTLKYIIILLLLTPLISAENYANYNQAELNVELESEVNLVSTGSNAKLIEAEATIHLIPIEANNQEIINLNTFSDPDADITEYDDKITYIWKNVYESQLKYGIKAKVKTKNTNLRIQNKISYPTIFDQSLEEYTKVGKYIDFNGDIEKLSDEIFRGETDLYHAVYKVANWVENNIDYDLNTLTESIVQKSSWVLENKQGVCDEITNLFISLLRVKKIPTKFISGAVYSNKNKEFENHGWAEAYFPKYGWLPFDITYSQYGWIDVTHIKLSETKDSGTSSIDYHWKSTDLDVNLNSLDIDVEIKELGEKSIPLLTSIIEPVTEKVGIGSYVPIKVTVENPTSFYIIPNIHITKSPPLQGKNRRSIFLEPKSIQTTYFIAKVPVKLNEEYIFRSELELQTSFGKVATSSIEISSDHKIISKEQAEKVLKEFEEQKKKQKFKDLNFECTAEGETYYEDEKINILCLIQNKGETRELTICTTKECKKESIKESEEKLVVFESKAKEKIIITAEDEEHLKYSTININIVKIPAITITNIEPLTVDYNEQVDLKLELESTITAYETIIYLGKQEILNTPEFQGKKIITLKTEGKELIGNLKFKMEFEDQLGQKYTQEEKYLVTVKNRPWYTYLYGWML